MDILYTYILDPFAFKFMQKALLASVIVGVICSVLSCYLIVKRWALLGDAISHAVLPGVGIAYLLGIQFFIGAVITGVLTALGIGFIERNSRIKEDAAMGIMFTSAFALGVLLISLMRTKTVDIYHILFGNVLGVEWPDLTLTILAGALVLLTVFVFYKELMLWSFDPVMASSIGLPVRFLHYLLMFILSLTIVASLQTVGIVLVIAILITPGATAYLLSASLARMMLIASIFGVLSAVIGLFVSFHLNVASGPSIVLVSAAFFFLAMFFSPRKGIVWEWRRRRVASHKALAEDFLKCVYSITELGEAAPDSALVSERLGITPRATKGLLDRMTGEGLVERDGDRVVLTPSGIERALAVIRSHRLWELYLTQELGLDWSEVHDQAEKLEHMAGKASEELDEILGKPAADPHGHPIPSPDGSITRPGGRSLSQVPLGESVVIKWVKDENPETLRYLAAMGLFPNKEVMVKGINTQSGYVVVEVEDFDYALTPEIAESVYVSEPT